MIGEIRQNFTKASASVGLILVTALRRRRSVQVSKLFMANIYAVYCAVKLVLLKKGRLMCDIFKETVLFLKWTHLRKSDFQKVY